MSDPFIGEIRMFGGTFAPRGWAFCNGQILPIAQNVNGGVEATEYLVILESKHRDRPSWRLAKRWRVRPRWAGARDRQVRHQHCPARSGSPGRRSVTA